MGEQGGAWLQRACPVPMGPCLALLPALGIPGNSPATPGAAQPLLRGAQTPEQGKQKQKEPVASSGASSLPHPEPPNEAQDHRCDPRTPESRAGWGFLHARGSWHPVPAPRPRGAFPAGSAEAAGQGRERQGMGRLVLEAARPRPCPFPGLLATARSQQPGGGTSGLCCGGRIQQQPQTLLCPWSSPAPRQQPPSDGGN